jgi:hypothetical protein
MPHAQSIQVLKEQDQFEIIPNHILLRRVDPPRRMYRDYRMAVQRDLFEGQRGSAKVDMSAHRRFIRKMLRGA